MPSNIFFPVGSHGGRITEDFTHTDIHGGKVWRVSAFSIPGAGSSFSVFIQTPAAEELHATFSVEANGPGIARLYEGPNASGGTAIAPVNALRTFSGSADSIVTTDPTMTASVGTTLRVAVIGATGFKSVEGGSVESELWILQPSTIYVMQFTADGATTRTVITAVWREC